MMTGPGLLHKAQRLLLQLACSVNYSFSLLHIVVSVMLSFAECKCWLYVHLAFQRCAVDIDPTSSYVCISSGAIAHDASRSKTLTPEKYKLQA